MNKQRGIGLTLIIALVAMLGGGGFLFFQNQKIKKAERERDAAIVQRDLTAGERDKAIAVAQENAATIAALESEKELVNKALNDLAAQKEVIRTNTVTREVIIQKQATSATSAAVTAPVIANIISAVQEDRIRRRGGQFIPPAPVALVKP